MTKDGFDLYSICPRLALARDQHNALVYERLRERDRLRAEKLAADRLLAHRELQLIRAGATGDKRYISRRQRKLSAAQRRRKRLG